MILIPSINHEEQVADAIAKHGSGVNLGLWSDSTKDNLLAEIHNFRPENMREKIRLNELSVFDGLGLDRVCELIAQIFDLRKQP